MKGARAIACLVAAACAAAVPPSAPSDVLGKPIDLTLVSNTGEPAEITVPGRKTVLDYWAPSCVPCKRKLPELVGKAAELRTQNAELVLIAVLAPGESTELAEQTLATWGLAGQRFLIDRESLSAKHAGVEALPAIQIFDSTRTLRWVGGEKTRPSDVISVLGTLD